MIAIHCRRRSSGASSFRALIGYMRRGGDNGAHGFDDLISYQRRIGMDHDRHDVLFEWGIGVASLDSAASEMRAIARLSRAKDPVAAFLLSWAPGEHPSEAQAREAVDIALAELGLADGHQAVAAMHVDKESHWHVHLAVNRVSWKTKKATDLAADRCSRKRDPWASSQAKIQRAARLIELRQSWQTVPGGYWKIEIDTNGEKRVAKAPPNEWSRNRSDGQPSRLSPKSRRFEQWTGVKSFERWVKEDGLSDALQDMWEREDCDLERLHLAAARFGCTIEAHGDKGLVIKCAGSASDAAFVDLLQDSAKNLKTAHLPAVKLSALDARLPSEARWARRGLWEQRFGTFESLSLIRDRRFRDFVDSPILALEAVVREQSIIAGETGLSRSLESMLNDQHQVEDILHLIKATGRLVKAREQPGTETFFTTAEMIETESQLLADAAALSDRCGSSFSAPAMETGLANCSVVLDSEQRAAFNVICGGKGDLVILTGPAGSGKSALFKAVEIAAACDGLQVRGIALSGRAAEQLADSSGIESATLASTLANWARHDTSKTAEPSRASLVVVDEAFMLSSTQLAQVARKIREDGGRLVLCGDPKQLTPIGPSSSAALLARSYPNTVVRLTTVFRQKDARHRQATLAFAIGRGDLALDVHQSLGNVVECATGEDAKAALLHEWMRDRVSHPNETQLGLAYRRADVRDLNRRATTALTMRGLRKNPRRITMGWGSCEFAAGDRIVLEKNDYSLGFRRGAIGTIVTVDPLLPALTVQFDGSIGTRVVDFNQYAGSASLAFFSSIHRAQGMSVSRAYWLCASPMTDSHLACTAMTRHRERDGLKIYWSRDQIRDVGELRRLVNLDRTKPTTLDHDFGREWTYPWRGDAVDAARKLVKARDIERKLTRNHGSLEDAIAYRRVHIGRGFQ